MNAGNDLINEARERLIFALDVPDRKNAEKYVKQLQHSVGCFKVGLELFVKEGPDILKMIKENSSADIFLDLKLHDIPATLSRALISAASHDVKYVTIHLEEGETLRKIPSEVKDAKLEVLAVTILTSISEEDLERFSIDYIRNKKRKRFNKSIENEESLGSGLSKLEEIVIERAIQAEVSDCAGVICSGEEVEQIKLYFGNNLKAIVPGIRPDWSQVGNDDQSRITTPKQAIDLGADLIVVGRPIRDAKDPKEAAGRILDEVSQSLKSK
ncbi:MAG: orotidine 5'-phosphate decarboxylase [Nitrospinaceae bacterium]|nr:MAG: orotidine 5'-phosphate decarboxylase [Nitrospinaceae bacterium]